MDLHANRVDFVPMGGCYLSSGNNVGVWRWPDAHDPGETAGVWTSWANRMWSMQTELTPAEARSIGQALIAAADHAEGRHA